MDMKDILIIDNQIRVPKYKQIIDSIINAIENKKILKGDKLESINTICKTYSLSRDTVMNAYNDLKSKGIIMSVPGKGYYIKSTQISSEENIFLLFDEFNAFKEDLYNSFISNLTSNFNVDIFFHHFNRKVFNNLITDSIGNYSKYIIMPGTFKNFIPLLSNVPEKKLFFLDQIKPELKNKYSAVYQNHENDINTSLISGQDLLKKYKKLILVFPGGKEPKGQVKGFNKFCKKHDWQNEVIATPTKHKITKGDVFIVPNDRHLVYLIKEINKLNYKLGTDVGIISYNDTPLKEILEQGITTISTDFTLMGKTLAELVMNKTKGQIENSTSLIIRNSL